MEIDSYFEMVSHPTKSSQTIDFPGTPQLLGIDHQASWWHLSYPIYRRLAIVPGDRS